MMRTSLAAAWTILILAPLSIAAGRQTESFDSNWLFLRGDPSNAQNPEFDDSSWKAITLPNDWAIAGPADQKAPSRGAGGFRPSGVAWYRKHFSLPAENSGLIASIEFDGVMANSDVWINGFHLGHQSYGYTSFAYDLTGHLNFDPNGSNVIAVRVDTSAQPASRWYAGAGINRHVRLVFANPVHLVHDATFITTPHVAADLAIVHVHTTITNESQQAQSIHLPVIIARPDGKTDSVSDALPPFSINPGASVDVDRDIEIKTPLIWDIDHPNLYQADVAVVEAGNVLDNEQATFGIRTFEFKADTGFWLNGRNLKIKGVCLHEVGGGMGTAVPRSIWESYLTDMKSIGANAIRTAHNPPSPMLLDVCDRMGFLVMDEMFDCWTVGKNPDDYHLYFKSDWQKDVTDALLRDRNHPSIILWSAGNEIRDINPNNDLGATIFTEIRDLMHKLDPTRPVTMAVLRPNQNHVYDSGFAELMDVVGQNYREPELLAAHAKKPNLKILGTENHPDLATWKACRDNPAYSGQFLWTGVDYLGESGIWPRIGSAAGLFDRTGEPKPSADQRRSWWTQTPMVAICRVGPELTFVDPMDPEKNVRRVRRNFADWTPNNSAPHQETIEAYSNCDKVELFLNDKTLGALDRSMEDRDAPRIWKVDFSPGKLKAVASNNGKVVATRELHTAGKPQRIVLTCDRATIPADWDDVAIVRAGAEDANGMIDPTFTGPITFTIDGHGTLAAVDSGDPVQRDPFDGSAVHAYLGKCAAFVRINAPGERITIHATANDLSPGVLSLTADAAGGEANPG